MEFVDKFDKRRCPLGKITERYEKIDGEYKQSMHLWIRNDKGKFLIQKRSMKKRIAPGIWSITGGGVDAGEKTVDTAVRECKEELGIDVELENLELIMTLKKDYNFVDVYLLNQNVSIEDITMQEEEVADVKWVTVEELREMMEKVDFAEGVTFYFDMFMKILERYGGRG